MNSFDFYKGLYDNAVSRRFDLDNALNIPVGLIVILLTLMAFIISSLNFSKNITVNWIIIGFLLISLILLLRAIFFLSKSYTDFFKNYRYLNLPFSYYLRKYQLDLESYNSKMKDEKDKIDFENQLIEQLNQFTDNHIITNEYRAKTLAKAKAAIVLSVFPLLIASILVITIKYLL